MRIRAFTFELGFSWSNGVHLGRVIEKQKKLVRSYVIVSLSTAGLTVRWREDFHYLDFKRYLTPRKWRKRQAELQENVRRMVEAGHAHIVDDCLVLHPEHNRFELKE